VLLAKAHFTLADLAQRINAELVGDPQHKIYSLATLQSATSNDLSFIANPAYKKYLSGTQAGGVIVHADLAHDVFGNKLIVENPYLSYAELTQLFDQSLTTTTGIHASAVIGDSCVLGNNISIGANAVIANGVTLGDGVIIGAGSFVGRDSYYWMRLYLSQWLCHRCGWFWFCSCSWRMEKNSSVGWCDYWRSC
jgi:UDP-3-O-[3-hydroxymyristoyl] glucosamine N-acyltransferase